MQFIIKEIGVNPYEHLKYISSVIIVLTIIPTIALLKNSKTIILFLLCLIISSSYIFHCFNILRQGLLFSVYLFTILFYYKNYNKLFIITSFLLPFCHTLGILLCLLNILFLIRLRFYFIIILLLPFILLFENNIYFIKIIELNANIYSNKLIYIKIILNILCYSFIYIFCKHNYHVNKLLYFVCASLIFFQLVFLFIPIISSRINNFCTLLLILLSFLCFNQMKEKYKYIISLLFPLYFLSYMFVCFSNNSVLNIFYE